jgi:hypothetical protein
VVNASDITGDRRPHNSEKMAKTRPKVKWVLGVGRLPGPYSSPKARWVAHRSAVGSVCVFVGGRYFPTLKGWATGYSPANAASGTSLFQMSKLSFQAPSAPRFQICTFFVLCH